ncbi:hypothetical protein H6G93_19010 [Nostoc sp. FACHB-973]|nr:hypothetical protein [Nostoc sp. FACHB-973]
MCDTWGAEGGLHSVYASDGRLLSAVYDACTRFDMLTEKARYSWYYNSIGRSLPVQARKYRSRAIAYGGLKRDDY